MSSNKKVDLKLPSFKKSISDFLKNESGSVTTKGAVSVAAMGIAAVGLSDIADATCDRSGGHFNGTANGHYSGTGTFGATIANVPNGSCSGYNVNYNYQKGCSTLSCDPINGLVNGHYNVTPTCSSSPITKHCNHVSSGDSGDSGDGGDSCG